MAILVLPNRMTIPEASFVSERADVFSLGPEGRQCLQQDCSCGEHCGTSHLKQKPRSRQLQHCKHQHLRTRAAEGRRETYIQSQSEKKQPLDFHPNANRKPTQLLKNWFLPAPPEKQGILHGSSQSFHVALRYSPQAVQFDLKTTGHGRIFPPLITDVGWRSCTEHKSLWSNISGATQVHVLSVASRYVMVSLPFYFNLLILQRARSQLALAMAILHFHSPPLRPFLPHAGMKQQHPSWCLYCSRHDNVNQIQGHIFNRCKLS